MTLFYLFYEFFLIGLFAIGGALAALPFLENLAGKYDWYTIDQLADMLAVSESTPGAIGLNMATFAGYRAAGLPGSLVATFSLILPSLIITTIVAKFLQRFRQSSLTEGVFYGIKPAVTGLIAVAFLQVLSMTLFSLDALRQGGGFLEIVDLRALCLFVLVFALMQKIKLHPVVFLALGAVAGLIFKL